MRITASGGCTPMRIAPVVPLATLLATVALAVSAQAQTPNQIRIFVQESDSWNIQGNGSGARPQTAEVIKTFRERCPAFVVTIKPDQANFIVKFDREAGKEFFLRRNKIVVSRANGDVIFTDSTRQLGNAINNACSAIAKATP